MFRSSFIQAGNQFHFHQGKTFAFFWKGTICITMDRKHLPHHLPSTSPLLFAELQNSRRSTTAESELPGVVGPPPVRIPLRTFGLLCPFQKTAFRTESGRLQTCEWRLLLDLWEGGWPWLWQSREHVCVLTIHVHVLGTLYMWPAVCVLR